MVVQYGQSSEPLSADLANFYSDTKTRPSRAMREAALRAEVGDEQASEDPTTLELNRRVASLLGKEAAIFMATGTMCNEVALYILGGRGGEVVCETTCHIANFEGGGPGAIAGSMLRIVEGDRGIFTADQTRAAVRPKGTIHFPETSLVWVEQTANMGGGAIWPLEDLNAVAAAAKEAGLATHMDGARLLNAVAATGISAKDYAAGYDSVWIDFTKGLGCPMGAAIAGSADYIQKIWRVRQMLGGGLRQSGFMAATCLYALDHNIERLAEDNALAAEIGRAIAQMPQVANILPVDSNIVIFDIAEDGPAAGDIVEGALADGCVIGALGGQRIRIVTHLDVSKSDGESLIAALRKRLG